MADTIEVAHGPGVWSCPPAIPVSVLVDVLERGPVWRPQERPTEPVVVVEGRDVSAPLIVGAVSAVLGAVLGAVSAVAVAWFNSRGALSTAEREMRDELRGENAELRRALADVRADHSRELAEMSARHDLLEDIVKSLLVSMHSQGLTPPEGIPVELMGFIRPREPDRE